MRPKTIICDIDGTLIEHTGGPYDQFTKCPVVLDGVIEKLEEWDSLCYRVILLTGRKESMRSRTEKQLEQCGIFYDQLVMGVGGGTRVLVNDLKPNEEDPNNPTAIAINIKRNVGLRDVKI